jgi:hypothetical protein
MNNLSKPALSSPVVTRNLFSDSWQRWIGLLFSYVYALPQKFVEIGPPADGTTWAITHNLRSTDVVVQVLNPVTGMLAGIVLTVVNENEVTITLAASVTTKSLRAVVLG